MQISQSRSYRSTSCKLYTATIATNVTNATDLLNHFHAILGSQDLDHTASQVLGVARRRVVLRVRPGYYDYYDNKVISKVDCQRCMDQRHMDQHCIMSHMALLITSVRKCLYIFHFFLSFLLFSSCDMYLNSYT